MIIKVAGVLSVFTALFCLTLGQRNRNNINKKLDNMMKEPQGTYESTIPGGPGQDYPVFAFAPPTSFSCAGLTPGYYADLESDCQAYQRCTETNDAPIATLLCPNGTLYNQQYFVCDWWFNVDCSVAPQFYALNDDVALAAAEANSLRRSRDYEN
eukprot:TRINITY_DN941_c0_g1_i2.p1 TRINITY_DN941_c0_g1~~TRINITY_DN941_c0_g1_i2.p1  ORF type:complete len:155 (-),score=36.57 TRINITY_DN941_c0_g1_i2:127-591(-)